MIKDRLIHWLARKLLPLIEESDIILFIRNEVYIDGTKLSVAEIRSLREEVRAFEGTRLHQVLMQYPLMLAKKKLFTEANDKTDLLFGKTILYFLDIQKSIMKDIKNVK